MIMESINFEALWSKMSEMDSKLDAIQKCLTTKGENATGEHIVAPITKEDVRSLNNLLATEITAHYQKFFYGLKNTLEKQGIAINQNITKLIVAIQGIEPLLFDKLTASMNALTAALKKRGAVKIWRLTLRRTTVAIICLSLVSLLLFALSIKQLADIQHLKLQLDTAIEYINDIKPLD